MADCDVKSESRKGKTSPEAFIPDLPSEDWEFNILLDEVANDITDEELKRLKRYCIGENGTGKGTLSEIKDAGDFFTHLRYRCRLTRDNIVVLQAMLYHLRRRDLQKKVLSYARRQGNVVHFYAPSDTPENGYHFLKIHVVGTDNFDRNQLEKLRHRVARLLVTPSEFVIVNGIEEANSILITFMVPEDCGSFIYGLDDTDAASLLSDGIDLIEFEKTVIDLKNLNKEPSTECVFQTNKEMESLSKRVEKLEKDIDHHQIQLLKSEREKSWYRTEFFKLKQQISSNEYIGWMATILLIYNIHVKVNKPFERLSTKAARAYFHLRLQESKKLNYSTEIIRAIIEANATVVKAKISEDIYIRLMVKDWQLQEMASTITFLQYEKEKLAFYLNIGEKEPVLSQREEFWFRNYSKILMQPLIPGAISLSATYNIRREDLNVILTKLSDELTKNERQKLLERLSDSEKTTVNKAPNSILGVLLEKQLKESKGQYSLGIWIEDVMKMINRTDLLQRFHDLAQTSIHRTAGQEQKPKMRPKPPGPRKSPARKHQRYRRNTVTGSLGRAYSDSENSSSGFGEMEEEKQNSLTEFQILNGRMQKIESVLDRLASNFRPEFPFSPYSKGTESHISSFIPNHK